MRLTAIWTEGQNVATDLPTSLVWEDGTRATLYDFVKHQDDTHTFRAPLTGGMIQCFFPETRAEVVYDNSAESWVVRGHGVDKTALEIPDPNATDAEIWAELLTLPTVYRATIVRLVALAA